MADLTERDQYARLTAGSANAVRGSAKTWETALTAFITLITAGVIIKGHDSTSDLSTGWRICVVALVGGGLLLAVFGLWQTVAAEAGTHPETATLQDIREAHGTLDAYQVYLAVNAARRLRWGIRSAAAAMTLLIAGVAATWLAPGVSGPRTYIMVTHGHTVPAVPQHPRSPGRSASSFQEQAHPPRFRLRRSPQLPSPRTAPEQTRSGRPPCIRHDRLFTPYGWLLCPARPGIPQACGMPRRGQAIRPQGCSGTSGAQAEPPDSCPRAAAGAIAGNAARIGYQPVPGLLADS